MRKTLITLIISFFILTFAIPTFAQSRFDQQMKEYETYLQQQKIQDQLDDLKRKQDIQDRRERERDRQEHQRYLDELTKPDPNQRQIF